MDRLPLQFPLLLKYYNQVLSELTHIQCQDLREERWAHWITHPLHPYTDFQGRIAAMMKSGFCQTKSTSDTVI